jgi:uncharacterized membrane protein
VLQSLPDYTTMGRARPWWAIWSSLERGREPPGYFIFLRGWRELFDGFGSIELVMRSMSVVGSLAALVLLFDTARLLHSPPAALWACALMALAGPQIQFAQEAAPYALAMALGLGACAAVVRMQVKGPSVSRAIALAICLLLMTLTTYFSVAAFVALAIYAGFRLRDIARRQATAAFLLAGALFAVSWGPYLFTQREISDRPFVNRDPQLLSNTVQRVALLPVRFLNEPMKSSRAASLLAGAAYLLPLLLLRLRPDLLLWVLWGGATIAMTVTVDLVQQTYYTSLLRYTLLASPAVYAIIAAILVHDRRAWLRHIFPAAALLSCVISLSRAYEYYFPPKPEWRDLAGRVARLSGDRDAMMFYGTPSEIPYLRALMFSYVHYLQPDPRPIVLLSTPPDERVRDALKGASGVWIVTTRRAPEVIALMPGFEPDTLIYDPYLPTLYRMTPAGSKAAR